MVPAVAYLSSPRYQAFIKEEPMQPSVAKMAREVDVSWDIALRASKIIGVSASTVEALQLVRYTSPDAEYKLHHDHGGYYGKATEHRPWTILIFLNDVSDGGHTAFPKLGLEVIPRGGDALIWSNSKGSEVDPDMVHMGKPPSKEGVEKYAVNVWFGEESFGNRMAGGESGEWS
jgi:prolyl 4-hydroxylase